MCSRLTARHPLQSAAPIGRTVYWPHDFTSATSLSTSSKTLSFLAPSAACIAIRTISRFRRYVLCITSADSSTRSSISRLIRKAGPPTFDTSNISDTKSESSIPSNSDPSNLRKPDPRYTDCQSETHAFGVDDANKTNSRIDHVPNPVPESGYFTQAPTGHSSLAPKPNGCGANRKGLFVEEHHSARRAGENSRNGGELLSGLRERPAAA